MSKTNNIENGTHGNEKFLNHFIKNYMMRKEKRQATEN